MCDVKATLTPKLSSQWGLRRFLTTTHPSVRYLRLACSAGTHTDRMLCYKPTVALSNPDSSHVAA